jgi:hypothetical protein
MAIELTHDNFPPSEPPEHCCFCYCRTRTWYAPKDVAVCFQCAEFMSPEDVPSKAKWCEAVSQRYPDPRRYRFDEIGSK